MLAGRLDGPTGGDVRKMIDDSLAVEKTGLWGRCYLDRRGLSAGSGPYAEGDGWLTKILTDTAPYLMPTLDDNRPELYSANYPMTGAALYFGWYAEQPAGPFTQPWFRFRPGAVACHIHSFSATSVRDPVHWWVGPLIEKGAAAVLGNVYEPYLSFTTHLDIFADRLQAGYTLAECAYAAQPALSWMNTVVGDPLYRPGLAWKNLESELDDAPASAGNSAMDVEGRAYWQGAQMWQARGAGAGTLALEKKRGAVAQRVDLRGARVAAGARRRQSPRPSWSSSGPHGSTRRRRTPSGRSWARRACSQPPARRPRRSCSCGPARKSIPRHPKRRRSMN